MGWADETDAIMDDDGERNGRPKLDLTLNIGDVLKIVMIAVTALVFFLNARDTGSEINKHQDEKILTHDIELVQMEKELAEIRKQQKEDMIDVRASLKSISDSLYEIKYALPRPSTAK